MTATAVTPPRTSLCVITCEDTVTVRGELGRWVVGAIRPKNPFADLTKNREAAVLVNHVTRDLTSTSMWVHPSTLTLVRKGNVVGDVLARDHDLRPTPLRYGIACTVGGGALDRVVDFGG